MKIFKNLTWLLSILMIGLFIVHEVFGIVNKSFVINILIYISFIILLVLNIIILNKIERNKTEKLYAISLVGMMSVLSVIIIILYFLNFTGNKNTHEVFTFPDNEAEQLKIVSLNELGEGTMYVVYEKQLKLGFSCFTNIKIDKNMNIKYDLEKIYKELTENKDAGFCYYSMRKY